MESSFYFPQPKRHNYTDSTTVDETNSNTNGTASSVNGGGELSVRFRPPAHPLYNPPGFVAFRLVCRASCIGGLIGKSGSIIKNLQQQTNSKIRVEDPNSCSDCRVITVTSPPNMTNKLTLHASVAEQEKWSDGDEWVEVSAAQEGVVRVFERVVEVVAEGSPITAADFEGVVSCRLLAGKNQAGAIIGKGGEIVEKIRRETGSRIKVLKHENIASYALPTDEIVEIEGDILAVKKAIVAVTGRLQEFLPFERSSMHGAGPFEVEFLPVPTLQQSPMLQPKPSDSTNLSLESEKILTVGSRTSQQEVVLKILCPNSGAGAVIGKGGSIIRALQNETGASICVGPILPMCDERVITISAVENAETKFSPAQKAVALVFNRFMGAGVEKGCDSDSKGSPIYARLVVPSHLAVCLLGKGGTIISEMRKMTGTGIWIFRGNQVPKCVLNNEEVVEITGEFLNVQVALNEVTGRLRDNILAISMSIGSGSCSSSRTNIIPYLRSMNHPWTSCNVDQTLLPSFLASLSVSGANQGNATEMGRKSPFIKGGVEIGSGGRSNKTLEIIVSDKVIGSIYGENGGNLARLKQISGAQVTVHEPRSGTTDRIVCISGTPDEIQSAQSLLQAFILSGSS